MPITRRAFGAGLTAAAAAQPAARPNILLILSDDHSRPYVGCYGTPWIKTPNLDRFASEGMRFDQCFTAAPQCVPSRTAILTGRSPVGARMGRFTSPLPPDVVSLPEMLREAGYFTGLCRRSFHLDGPGRNGKASDEIMERHGLRTFKNRVDFFDPNSPPGMTERRVNEFFDQRPKEKPFFFWVNFNDPHHVWDSNAIPEPHDPAKLTLPPHLPDLPGVRADLGRYCDEIARMDGEFQLVLDTVKRRAGLDNTLVVFMGDNGMAFPHGKGSLYDPGLNVPLLVRWPERVRAGGSSTELVSGEDITPTMLAAAGLTPRKEMTGRSFLPVLQGSQAEHRKHIFAARLVHGNAQMQLDGPSSGWDLSRCVRTRTHKLIYNCTPWVRYSPVDSARDPGWSQMVAAHEAGKLAPEIDRAYFTRPRPIFELFDLRKDPSELTNLAGRPELASIERELKLALQEKMFIDYDFLPLPTPD